MKFEVEQDVIIGNSTSEKKKFSIASSAKAFKVLSSSLYKNKVLAIVRELSCNALDAHKLINNNEPFLIKVPTDLEPVFKIRDFGPGLSEELMEELYTTYFASSKTSSNDFIGAMGLGSKSPFSYTTVFTVTSYQNGIGKIYNLYLDSGEPNIQIFGEFKTDEKDGIEVNVPVNSKDILLWSKNIVRALKPFDQSQYKLDVDLNINPIVIPEEGYLRSNDLQYNVCVLYGNIVYPIDSDIITIVKEKGFMLTRNSNIIIKFELGELDIAPSREELSYDEQTIEVLTKRINEISKESEEYFYSLVDGLSMKSQYMALQSTLDGTTLYSIKNVLKFNGKSYNEHFSPIIYPNIFRGLSEDAKVSIYNYTTMKKVTLGNKQTSRFISYDRVPHYNDKNIFVIHKDCKRSILKIIEELNFSREEDCIGIIVTPDEEVLETVTENLQKIMCEYSVTVIKSSTIRIPTTKKAVRGEVRTNVAIVDENGVYSEVKMTNKEIANCDLPYIRTYNKSIVSTKLYSSKKVENYLHNIKNFNRKYNQKCIILNTAQSTLIKTESYFDVITKHYSAIADEFLRKDYIIDSGATFAVKSSIVHKVIDNLLTNSDLYEIRNMVIPEYEKYTLGIDGYNVIQEIEKYEIVELSNLTYEIRNQINKSCKHNINEFKSFIEKNPLVTYAIACISSISELSLTETLINDIKQFGIKL